MHVCKLVLAFQSSFINFLWSYADGNMGLVLHLWMAYLCMKIIAYHKMMINRNLACKNSPQPKCVSMSEL